VVALHADTGKIAWYFQTSPNDTHDWDSTQVPVLFDAPFNGQPRKMLAIAARAGGFYVLDRATGKNLVSTDFVKTNWTLGRDAKGQPIPNPEKKPSVQGTLVSPNQGGATNWYPPTFDPQTGLFYLNSNRAFSVYYLYDASDNPQGWGGNDRGGYSESQLLAIDYKTGKPKWVHHWETGSNSGLLTTAGNVLFTGAPGATFEALNAATGEPLWHTHLMAGVNAPPSTWELDGKQYVVVGAGDMIYTFILNSSK
jgi:alcohol dehydrogenase (cytochrome c)